MAYSVGAWLVVVAVVAMVVVLLSGCAVSIASSGPVAVSVNRELEVGGPVLDVELEGERERRR